MDATSRARVADVSGRPSERRTSSIPAVDILRGITIIWMVLFHLHADTRGVPGARAGAAAFLTAVGSGDLVGAFGTAATALVGLPSFRIDLFLFVSGLALMLGPFASTREFLRRRLNAVLPSYWLATLLVLAVFIPLAAVRASILGHAFGPELQGGALLGRAPYRFEPLDIIRSLSIFGRFEDGRTMQVIAPSMWYVLLVLQAYCVFPALRALLARLGTFRFLTATFAITWLVRGLAFGYPPAMSVDGQSLAVGLLPLRLAPFAAGMAAARWAEGLRTEPTRRVSLGLAGPAVLLILATVWACRAANVPHTFLGVIGPIAVLVPALPGLWVLTAAISAVPALRRILTWSGRHSITILVVQDPLRFVVGTAMSLGGKLGGRFWWIAPAYLGTTLVLAWFWSPVPAWIARRVRMPSVTFQPVAGRVRAALRGTLF